MTTTAGAVCTRAPVRGAQSFVGVMSEVWQRSSLTWLEILWRWAAGAPVLALVWWRIQVVSPTVHVDTAALQAMTVFKPVAAFDAMHATWAAVIPAATPVAMWLLPFASVLWLGLAAVGRTAVMQRFDKTLRARSGMLLVLGALRAGLLAMVWAVWVWGVGFAVRVSLTGPAARGAEPSVVLFCAMLIVGSLALYVLWGLVSWPFYLAPLLAMQLGVGPGAALKAAFASRAVRGKLVEINLVMNIVRIALIVLAMVFSASPLPFSSVETQTFLNFWWCGVGLLYLGISDYFHVVRSAAYLSLWRTYNFSAPGVAPGA